MESDIGEGVQLGVSDQVHVAIMYQSNVRPLDLTQRVC